MRIVGGRFRGRTIKSSPGNATRPMPDRVREMLFQRVGSDLVGRHIADVFSGTGTVGLEALSRGAASIVFFERDRRAFEILRSNIEHFGVQNETFSWSVDVLRTSFRPKKFDGYLPYDVIFFDPPYRMADQLTPGRPLFRSLQRLGRSEVSAQGGQLILRTQVPADPAVPECWQLTDVLKMTTMQLHFYTRIHIPAA